VSAQVTLRALVIEDCARTADREQRPAVARLLRRADVSREDLTAAALDLRARTAHAAALAMLATETSHADWFAVDALADECGLLPAEWTEETAREQGVEVSP
jgi:hypothetical protein